MPSLAGEKQKGSDGGEDTNNAGIIPAIEESSV